MQRLNEIYVASQKAEKTRRLVIEQQAKANGLRVIGWRNGKPVVRKYQGAGHATGERRMA
ncbi:hypothetical protein ACFFJB_14800 [Camelimonas abortus]|uniref:Uncharacterized protein n=1 Tax=Camelimonas abortus TaxID=1017184 RepID=A0ABV7LI53_9HYPH